jgi:hypothetical protein
VYCSFVAGAGQTQRIGSRESSVESTNRSLSNERERERSRSPSMASSPLQNNSLISGKPSGMFSYDTVGPIGAAFFKNHVTRDTKTHIPATVISSQRHTERNHKVPGQSPRPGPPWNVVASLRVSLRGSKGSLNAGLRN